MNGGTHMFQQNLAKVHRFPWQYESARPLDHQRDHEVVAGDHRLLTYIEGVVSM